MASLESLSNAKAILLTTRLCARGDVASLPQLHNLFPKSLPLERLLRIILTFLPESTEPQSYIHVLKKIVGDESVEGFDNANDNNVMTFVENVSEAEARRQVRRIRLLPLKWPYDEENDDDGEPLTQFLIHRAHLIDSETSLQPLILDLLLPFYENRPTIRTWLISSLLPLLRLDYEYYPHSGETFSVEALESMDDSTAVNVLLSMTGDHRDRDADAVDLTKNLRGLIGPWLYGSDLTKRKRLNETSLRNSIVLPQGEAVSEVTGQISGWQTVNEWLLSRYLIDRESVTSAFTTWNGPEDVDLGGYEDAGQQTKQQPETTLEFLRTRYSQTGLAVIYATSDSSKAALDDSIKILGRAANLVGLEDSSIFSSTDWSPSFDADFIESCSGVLLLQNVLLLPSNSLTQPSTSSISFLSALLASMQILNEHGHSIPCRTAASIYLYDREDRQRLELQSILTSITKYAKPGPDWRKIRERFLWLRDWKAGHHLGGVESSGPGCYGLFWRVSKEVVEAEILKAMLAARGKSRKKRKLGIGTLMLMSL